MKPEFIVIDDSQLDCFIAEKLIRHTGKSSGIKTFTSAGSALEYIKQRTLPDDDSLTVLLLDVLMPVMSGFDFVEAFEKLPQQVQDRYLIIALTSSMNKNDMNRISSYQAVKHLLGKPITTDALSALLP